MMKSRRVSLIMLRPYQYEYQKEIKWQSDDSGQINVTATGDFVAK